MITIILKENFGKIIIKNGNEKSEKYYSIDEAIEYIKLNFKKVETINFNLNQKINFEFLDFINANSFYYEDDKILIRKIKEEDEKYFKIKGELSVNFNKKSENYIFAPNILFNYDNLIEKNAIKTILEYKTLIEKTFLVEINKINEKWIELKKENKKRLWSTQGILNIIDNKITDILMKAKVKSIVLPEKLKMNNPSITQNAINLLLDNNSITCMEYNDMKEIIFSNDSLKTNMLKVDLERVLKLLIKTTAYIEDSKLDKFIELLSNEIKNRNRKFKNFEVIEKFINIRK